MTITIEEASAIKMLKDSDGSLSTIFAKSNIESLLMSRLDDYKSKGLTDDEAKEELVEWCKNNMSEKVVRKLISN